MNQQQRKHCMIRAYNTLVAKADEIQASSSQKLTAYNQATKVSMKDILSAITDGSLSPRETLKNKGSYNAEKSLSTYFDVEAFKESLLPAEDKRPVCVRTYIDSPTSGDRTAINTNWPDDTKRVQAIKKELQRICDDFMLGDAEEAVEALKQLEDKAF